MPPSQDRTASNRPFLVSQVQFELQTKFYTIATMFREERSSECELGERWELDFDGPIACWGVAESINASTHEARRFVLPWTFKIAWGLTIQ
jgi:hypothetical protein